MLVELDDAVGQLTDLLTEFRMYNDTVIFMTTDNGGMVRFQVDNTTGGPLWPASAGSNAPFRGSKATLFEGGLRGTAFVGGGFIPASARGTVYEGLMHLVDFPATVRQLFEICIWNQLCNPPPGRDSGRPSSSCDLQCHLCPSW